MILLDCAGCNKTFLLALHPNAVFGTCVGQDVVELLRQSFSDEDQEALVPVYSYLHDALALMLQDERTTMDNAPPPRGC